MFLMTWYLYLFGFHFGQVNIKIRKGESCIMRHLQRIRTALPRWANIISRYIKHCLEPLSFRIQWIYHEKFGVQCSEIEIWFICDDFCEFWKFQEKGSNLNLYSYTPDEFIMNLPFSKTSLQSVDLKTYWNLSESNCLLGQFANLPENVRKSRNLRVPDLWPPYARTL